ncbi:MAG: hypothetical protein MUC87_09505 [Bacteroidia bacterium]|jgi:hypothetical protein|nr:hypothetical protein [Bacteroidia bacterium]
MSRHLTISIPEPCSVPWNSMSRVDDYRRHCNSCAMTVTDFTEMSDDEIVSYLHEKAAEKPCGRFTAHQLNRPMKMIPAHTQKAVWWKAAVLLPLSLWSKNALAQTNSHIQDTTTRQPAQVFNNVNTDDSLPSVILETKVKCVLPDTVKAPYLNTVTGVYIDTLKLIRPFLQHEIVTGGVPMIMYQNDFRWNITPAYTITILFTPVYDSLVRARDSVYEALKLKLWGKNTVENSAPEPAKPESPPHESITALEPPRRWRVPRS